MTTLADRVEVAEGPSRELDAEIARDISGNPTEYWYGRFDGVWSNDATAPHYTASLDAALTLVPEGWHTGAYYQGPSGKPHRWILRTIADGEQYYRDKEATAATPALALCAAALRAREVQHGE